MLSLDESHLTFNCGMRKTVILKKETFQYQGTKTGKQTDEVQTHLNWEEPCGKERSTNVLMDNTRRSHPPIFCRPLSSNISHTNFDFEFDYTLIVWLFLDSTDRTIGVSSGDSNLGTRVGTIGSMKCDGLDKLFTKDLL